MKKIFTLALIAAMMFTSTLASAGANCSVEKNGVSVFVYGTDANDAPITVAQMCASLKNNGFVDSSKDIRMATYVIETTFQEGSPTPGVMLLKNHRDSLGSVGRSQVGRMAWDDKSAIEMIKLIE